MQLCQNFIHLISCPHRTGIISDGQLENAEFQNSASEFRIRFLFEEKDFAAIISIANGDLSMPVHIDE